MAKNKMWTMRIESEFNISYSSYKASKNKIHYRFKIMIFLDRLVRFIKGDMFLPRVCYANNKVLFNRNCNCTCKSFCRHLPGNGKVSLIYVKQKQ